MVLIIQYGDSLAARRLSYNFLLFLEEAKVLLNQFFYLLERQELATCLNVGMALANRHGQSKTTSRFASAPAASTAFTPSKTLI